MQKLCAENVATAAEEVQGQLDGMKMSDEEKVAYQNPAYRN